MVNCSFCGKSQSDVKYLVVHGEVAICENCVQGCSWTIARHEAADKENAKDTPDKLKS